MSAGLNYKKPLKTSSLPYYNNQMVVYGSAAEYEADLQARSGLPRGFRAGTLKIDFHPDELPGNVRFPMNLTLIEIPEGTSAAAGVFTRNALPGAPVILCRKRIAGPRLRGILINNKVANVCAPGGLADAERVTAELARVAGGSPDEWLYASTGVIGWKIPGTRIINSLPQLVGELQDDSVLTAARGIMTTDRYPKVRSRSVGNVSILGIAKGAGMIEPNMATMLSFILTDADLSREQLQRALSDAADSSFNSISIDSDQSTSDMALIFSSGKEACPDYAAFVSALRELCQDLARDIVRNGEGTAHLIEVKVTGGRNDTEARGIAKAVINSPLVKTAIYGNDPNLGRLVAALGDYAGNHAVPVNQQTLRISLGEHVIFSEGEFRLTPQKETALSALMKEKSFSSELKGYPEHDGIVPIEIDLQSGTGASRVWGSDLSYEYIRENAEYRS